MRVRSLLLRLSLACLLLVAVPLAPTMAEPGGPEFVFTLGESLPNPTDHRPPTVPMRLAVSSDGSRLYVLRAGGSLDRWNIHARERVQKLATHGVFAYAASAGSHVRRSATGALFWVGNRGEIAPVTATTSALAALSADGDTLALVGEAGGVDIWSLGVASRAGDTPPLLGCRDSLEISSLGGGPTSRTFVTSLPARNGLAVSRDGALIAAAEGTYDDDTGHTTLIELWRRGEDEALLQFDERDDGVVLGMWNVLFSPDGSLLAADSQKDGRSGIRVWDIPTGKARVGADGFNAYWARSLAFSEDSRYVASGDEKGNVWIRDLSGGPTRHFSRDGVVQSLAFSPDGAYLAVGLWDSTVEFWRVGTSN